MLCGIEIKVIADRFEISILRDFYGSLLTEKQDEMLRLRYDDDLSFGEIAEILGVSRQAVLDSLNKGEKHLVEYEEKLKCLDRQRRILAVLDEMEKDDTNAVSVREKVAEIKSILEE
ncbi:MAG: hypothetical protein NC037_06095 [Bacteroides sp.]|nr:DNA-binding protein [Bacillota bacterium]MCM1393701.1 DNA-binding protein [[Eubacterium] siraeum]MCM1456075.1 hypothetical protein [Bacteroides sp.]